MTDDLTLGSPHGRITSGNFGHHTMDLVDLFLVYITVLGFCLFLALIMFCFWKYGFYWERYFIKNSSSFDGLIVTRVVDEYELNSDDEEDSSDLADEEDAERTFMGITAV